MPAGGDRCEPLARLAAGQHACRHIVLDADTETPVSAWLKLAQEGRGDFLLESVEGGRTRGRYSLIGLDPDLAFRATGDRAELNREWRQDRGAFQPAEAPTRAALRPLVGAVRMEVPGGVAPAR
ncbi:MAG: anthranilate synthase component I, partial [Sandaracinobacter sp.]